MHIKIFCLIDEPIRKNPSFDERWNQEDKGLITAWEVGRKIATDNLETVKKVINGELPQLEYKGGHDKKLKATNHKFGTFYYLAELQGIKGENLDIDTERDDGKILICSKTKMKTIFTSDIQKIKES